MEPRKNNTDIQDKQTRKQRRKNLSHWLENKVSVFKDVQEVDSFISKQRNRSY